MHYFDLDPRKDFYVEEKPPEWIVFPWEENTYDFYNTQLETIDPTYKSNDFAFLPENMW